MSQNGQAHAYTQKATIQMQNTYDGNFQVHGVGKDKVHSMKFHHKDRGFLIPQNQTTGRQILSWQQQ